MTLTLNHLNLRRRLIAAGAATAAGLVLLAGGCAGHGGHTREGLSLAEKRSMQLKSGTEWNMARQAFLAGNLDKALRKVDDSLAINPLVAKSHLLKGRILIEKSRLGEALESLEQATILQPEMHEAYYYMGIVNERLTRLDAALASYESANRLEPANGQYAIAVAEVMIDLDRTEDARTFLEGEDELFQNNAAVRQTLGQIAMLQQRYDDAVTLFNEARLLNPESQAIIEDLIDAQVAAQRFAEAEYFLSRLLSSEDNASRRDLRHLRAKCLVELDRPVEARQVLQELVDGSEGATDVEAWITYGQVSWMVGDAMRLRQAVARVEAIAPKRAEGYILRALSLRHAGQPARALEQVETALTLSPDQPMMLTLKALIQQDLGNHEQSVQTLQRALAADPDNQSIASLIESTSEVQEMATVTDDE